MQTSLNLMMITGLLSHFAVNLRRKANPYFSKSSLGLLLHTCSEPGWIYIPLQACWRTPKTHGEFAPQDIWQGKGAEEKVEWDSCNCIAAFLCSLAGHHPKHKESIQQLADKQQEWKIDAVSGLMLFHELLFSS